MSHIPLVNGDTYATLRAFLNEMSLEIDDIYTVLNRHEVLPKICSSVTTQNLFSIAGGAIKLDAIVGQVTTAIAAGANNTKLVYTSTGGAAVDLCAVLNVASAAIRKTLTITGIKADALKLSPDEGVTVIVDATSAYVILNPGIISMNCSATTTGVIRWEMAYEPVSADSLVTAL